MIANINTKVRPEAPPMRFPSQLDSRFLRRFVLRSHGLVEFIDVETVDWIEAEKGQVHLHLGTARRRLAEQLGVLEQKLDPKSFLRIHRSVIVNRARVQRLEWNARADLRVVLDNGRRLAVGRQRTASVRTTLLETER
ncbi:MAG: LytTR family DNA-binding domain-containing protein [Acidobacteriota bacterium]